MRADPVGALPPDPRGIFEQKKIRGGNPQAAGT